MQHHDLHYRRLFSQPGMIRALIEGMLPPSLRRGLDLDSLEALPGDLVGGEQHARQADMLWRLRRSDGDGLHLLLLLEHQSSGDRHMALRVLSYAALAWESLYRRRLLRASQRLPAVLPVVLYSGVKRWRHALDVAALRDAVPPALEAYQPAMRYLLIDEGAWVEQGVLPEGNLASLLFRLEHNQGLADTGRLLQTLVQRLQGPQHQELRQAFGRWLRHIVLPRAWPGHIALPDTEELTEIAKMATLPHSRDWTLKFRQEGEAEGLRQGLSQGRSAGQAELLERLLARRFGPLPDGVALRLAQATPRQLEDWALNVLDAATLDEVWRTP